MVIKIRTMTNARNPTSTDIHEIAYTDDPIHDDDSCVSENENNVDVLPVLLRRSNRKTMSQNYKNLDRYGVTRHHKNGLHWVKHISTVEDHAVNVKQLNFKRGVEVYGDAAKEAIKKELRQVVVDYEVCSPVMLNQSDVSFMRTHDLITEKLDGKIKARYVVGKVAKQRGLQSIDWGIDTYSPTIDMKLLNTMASLCLDEKLRLEVWDIRGAFLQAKMATKGIYARIEPHIAEYMVELKPDWVKFLKHDGSLLVELHKAWYGTEAASALWYQTIKSTIMVGCGYQQHSKVDCLYYKTLDNNQRAYMLLHVDDIGALMPADGVERNRVKDIIEKNHGALQIQEGDMVTYIGVELTRDHVYNRFEVRQSKRIQKLCEKYNISKAAACPNQSSLLKEDSSPLLNTKETSDYRSLVMSMRYVAMTSMPECLFICSYLATWQTCATHKNYNDAIHVLKYMYGRVDSAMYIYAIGSKDPIIRVYADAAFAIHKGSYSHGGIVIYIGGSRCAVYNSSSKIAAMVKSSTDAEIMEFESATYLGDYYKMVLEEIGYNPKVIYMQDNDAAATLVKNSCNAYDKKRRWVINAINSVYTHINDIGASVEACISSMMHADIHTKPLTGELFIYHRKMIRGDYDVSNATM